MNPRPSSRQLPAWLAASLTLTLLAACGGNDTPAPEVIARDISAPAPVASPSASPSPAPAPSAPPASANEAAAPAGCVSLAYNANAAAASGNPYPNGSRVCFLASTTELQFSGKILANPVRNAAVSAPFSAYAFLDGSVKYEVVFNATTLREINVLEASGSPFYGQFKP